MIFQSIFSKVFEWENNSLHLLGFSEVVKGLAFTLAFQHHPKGPAGVKCIEIHVWSHIISGFTQASLCKIQGLFKDFLKSHTVFKKHKFMKNTVKILLEEC